MNKKRLLNVARALRESKEPRAFTMDRFGWPKYLAPEHGHTCGTPACALGHYAARCDLQRAFRLDDGELKSAKNDGYHYVWYCDPLCQKHFDLSQEQLERLFSAEFGCGGAKTAKQAARFIERFVARGGK